MDHLALHLALSCPLLEFDGETPAGDQPVPVNRYLWGTQVDMLLAAEEVATGNLSWPLTDQLGTIRDIAIEDGTSTAHREFDSFGNESTSTEFLFGYTGRPVDHDTGLQNNLNRWYDPNVGRWISKDPIGFAAGDANLYRYVGNQSTTYTDPSGLEGEHHRWDMWRGQGPNGRQGTYFQKTSYDMSWWQLALSPLGSKTGMYNAEVGPAQFVPDTRRGGSSQGRTNILEGIGDLGGAGSKSVQCDLENFANNTKHGQQIGGMIVVAGSLFVPGPEDAVWAAAASRYGMRLLGEGFQRGIGVLGRVLSKSELDHAARLAMRSDGVLLNIVTETDGIMAKAGGPCFYDAKKMERKLRGNLRRIRERYPDIGPNVKRSVVPGGPTAREQAEQAARFRVSQGNARIGPGVAEGVPSNLYYQDGPITWVFDMDGKFRSVRENFWDADLLKWVPNRP